MFHCRNCLIDSFQSNHLQELMSSEYIYVYIYIFMHTHICVCTYMCVHEYIHMKMITEMYSVLSIECKAL